MFKLLNLALGALQLASLALAGPLITRDDGKGGHIDIDSTTFNTLSLYNQYAAAAYCKANFDPAFGQINKPLKCASQNCPLVENSRTNITLQLSRAGVFQINAYVAIDYDRSLVVFAVRGTDTTLFANAISNFLILAAGPLEDVCAGCRGATSYSASWKEIAPLVLARITEALNDNVGFKVVVAGHSLGGAVGGFAAYQLRSGDNPISTDLATFGQPRFGNTVLAKLVDAQNGVNNSTNYRVTHLNDIVPNTPFEAAGYSHTQPHYFIQTGNNVFPQAGNVVTNSVRTNPIRTLNLATVGTAHSIYFNTIDACGGALPATFTDLATLYIEMANNGTAPTS